MESCSYHPDTRDQDRFKISCSELTRMSLQNLLLPRATRLVNEHNRLYELWQQYPKCGFQVRRDWQSSSSIPVAYHIRPDGVTRSGTKIQNIINDLPTTFQTSTSGALYCIEFGAAPGDTMFNVLAPRSTFIMTTTSNSRLDKDLTAQQVLDYTRRVEALRGAGVLLEVDPEEAFDGDVFCRGCRETIIHTLTEHLSSTPRDGERNLLLVSDVGREVVRRSRSDYVRGTDILVNCLDLMTKLRSQFNNCCAIVKLQTLGSELVHSKGMGLENLLRAVNLCDQDFVCHFVKPLGSSDFNQEIYAVVLPRADSLINQVGAMRNLSRILKKQTIMARAFADQIVDENKCQ